MAENLVYRYASPVIFQPAGVTDAPKVTEIRLAGIATQTTQADGSIVCVDIDGKSYTVPAGFEAS